MDVKSDEGLFLEYSCRSKAYQCLNLSTHKIIESAHVRIDEFAKKTEEESKKEPEDYKRFVYIEPNTLPDTSINKDAAVADQKKATRGNIVENAIGS